MRKYLLLVFFSVLTASCIRAQITYPTNREIYNFSVGDTFIYSYYNICDIAGDYCTHYYSMVVTGKSFSPDSNTVYYDYQSFGWTNNSVWWVPSSFSDLDSPVLQGQHTHYIIDTTFVDSNSYCVPLSVADSSTQNILTDADNYEYEYATGLGKTIDNYYVFPGGIGEMGHEMELVYYHKGNVICGTFDSTWLINSVNNIEPLIKPQLYPNPAADKIYIKGLQQPASYGIFEAMGKICAAGKSIDEINVSNLLPGIYFIKLTVGESAVFEKFVKQ